jgi:hypothetical protein
MGWAGIVPTRNVETRRPHRPPQTGNERRRTTMDATHTPGPWTVPGYVCGPDIGIIGNDRIVAMVTNDEDRPIDDAEQLANARLMAAAPELLDSLRYMVANAEAEGWSELMTGDAAAAIAKAEGRVQA